jgi:hypothetical protein
MLSESFIQSILGLDESQVVQKIAKEKRIASLWAGYGTITSVDVTIISSSSSKKRHNNTDTISLIIKRVKPPMHNDPSDVSHERKLKSYHIEAYFYKHLAPLLLNNQESKILPCRIAIPYSIENVSSSTTTKTSASFDFILEDLSIDYNESYSSSLSSINQTKQAITWLAAFHATFYRHSLIINTDDENEQDFVWKQGGYWHLKTRLDEWNSIPSYQSYIHKSAHAIDERMNEIGNGASHTLIHGDYKDANLLFGSSSDEECHCAVVDFQYCGIGYGVKDLVMWVVSSIPSATFSKLGGEDGVIRIYHEALCTNMERIQKLRHIEYKKTDLNSFLNIAHVQMQYELALIDYVRFMSGWGVWGANSGYAVRRASELLKEIAGSDKNMKRFDANEWRDAVYEKYPLSLF